MPIVIRELFSSDPLSEVLEKINFNFDQIVLSGGGPPGPQGIQGVPGIPGPQGERGDHWQAGSIAPTSDHGPNFGPLKDFDFWLASGGTVFYWDSTGATWNATSVNLRGPQGPPGAAGGSFEFKYYQGITGGVKPAFQFPFSNYLPNAIIGGTTNPSGNADFITVRNYDNVSLFLGDGDWAYNNLTNFGILDFNGAAPSPPGPVSQRIIPKLTLIQTGIDTSGNGGFSFGAYGATNAKGATLSNYLGSTGATTDARNFFNAGYAIDVVGPTYNHYFKAGTRSIDFELYAGDKFNSSLGLTGAITGFYYPEMRLLTTEFGRTVIKDTAGTNRLILERTRNRFEKPLIINTIWPGSTDSGMTLDNVGVGRNRGAFYIGDFSASTNSLGIGYGRTADGISNLSFYSNGTTPTTASLLIQRSPGANGQSFIQHQGTGTFDLIASGLADIRFATNTSTAMIISSGQNVGIGTTTPTTRLDVNGAIRTTGSAGLPATTGSGPILAGIVTNPNIGKLYMGDGTGWKFHFSKRAFSVDTDLVTIQDNGNVGIGITSPTQKLHIIGTQLIDGNLQFSNADRSITNISNFALSLGTNNTERARITAAGDFGIGTTTPSTKLHVSGTGSSILTVQGSAGSYINLINSGTTIRGKIGFSSAASNALEIQNTQSGGSISIFTTTAGELSLTSGADMYAYAGDYLYLESDLGTSLQVDGKNNLTLGSDGYASFGTDFATSDSRIEIDGANAAGNADLPYPILIRNQRANSGTSRNGILFQKKQGNAAISAPNLLGGLYFGGWDGTQFTNGDTTGGAYILAQLPSNWSGTAKPTSLLFGTGSTATAFARMAIDQNGSVIMGTSISSPIASTTKLQVYGDVVVDGDISITNGTDRILGGTGTAALPAIAVNSTSGMYYGSSALRFSLSGTEKFTIAGSQTTVSTENLVINNPTGSAIFWWETKRAAATNGKTRTFLGRFGDADDVFLRVDLQTNVANYNAGLYSFSASAVAQKDGGGSWASYSDIRLKENIETIPGIESIKKLRGVTFNLKKNGKKTGGFIADEVEEHFPHWVHTAKLQDPLEKEIVNDEYAKQLEIPFEWNAIVTEAIKEIIDRLEKLEAKS